jgi:hypothetical protein
MDAMAQQRARAKEPEAGIDRGVARVIGEKRFTVAISFLFSSRCVCIRTVGNSFSSAPAAASCSSVEVMAKRGVTA